MEALAIEMTVRQCISTARRGVTQGFPRWSSVSIKIQPAGSGGLQTVGCEVNIKINRPCFYTVKSERQRQNKDSQALTLDKMKNLSYSRLLAESFYLNLQKSAFYKYL